MTAAELPTRRRRRRPRPATVAPDAELLLKARNVTKRFGGLDRRERHQLRHPGGLDRQPDRAQRRRQDDVLQHHRRHLRPDRGLRRVQRPADDRAHGPRLARAVPVDRAARSRWRSSPAVAYIATDVQNVGVIGGVLALATLRDHVPVGGRPAAVVPAPARAAWASSAAPGPTTWSSPASAGPSRTSACSRT